MKVNTSKREEAMSTHHQKLFEKANRAIHTLFSDLTVSHEQTLESLELLRDEMDILIEAVGNDIERELLANED